MPGNMYLCSLIVKEQDDPSGFEYITDLTSCRLEL